MMSSSGGESSGVGDRHCIEMGEVNRKKKEGRNFHNGQNTYRSSLRENQEHATSHTHTALWL